MSETEIHRFGLSDPQDTEVVRYRAVSGLAVGGLVIALFSPIALAHPVLWTVPVIGIVTCVLALMRIGRETPPLIGRKAALAGLFVSVLLAVAAPATSFTYWQLVDREARQFAFQWFGFLRQGDPYKAHQLTAYPEERLPLEEGLREHYAKKPEAPGEPQDFLEPPVGGGLTELASLERDAHRDLESYVGRPEIRSLLNLGQKAQVHYYDTERSYHDRTTDVVQQVYAVTCEEAGKKESYFLQLILKRYPIPGAGRAAWQVFDFKGAVRPKAMGKDER